MLKRLVDSIAKRNVSREDIETFRKYILLMLLFCVGMVAIAVMAIIAYIQSNLLLGTLGFGLMLVIALLVYMIWKQRKFERYSAIIIFVIGLFVLYLFITGGVNNYAHVWCYVFPVTASFVIGYRKGFAYSIAVLILMVISQMFAHFAVVDFIYEYSINYLIFFFAVYIIITIISCIAEWARAITYAKMDKYHDSMKNTICELEYTRARLREMTNIDPLTKIYNKRFLTASSKALVQSGEAKYVVSLFFDIDDFKKYNDYYGHIEGDKVLVKVVEIIKRQVRSCDGIFARFGGEELVYLMKTNDVKRAEAIAQRILADFKKNRIEHARSRTGYVTVSIGIAYCLKKDFTAWKTIVIQSDAAMYQAKRNGKNTYYIA